ncbi:TonB-linked SusC/RagA family outer membrane protein [Pedobacter sp. CAN_A7]|uniref:SusC/RagA family TonB-linked outer membrane protein n=1 Tax=Pedobacter sp. CAN_A7 TaxID=2787722 RepID=UPI0018CB8196
MLLGYNFLAIAQDTNASLSGIVESDKGGTLPGVSIDAKNDVTGERKIALTNENGLFKIQSLNSQQTYTITFSYIGFESHIVRNYKFKTGEQASLLVKLKEQSNTLEQIVVTGYSSQRKKDLTGAVSIINVNEAKTVPVAGLDQALQGKAAGVNVVGDGQPGGGVSVRIRGFSTIGNNDPLYVIDGVPTTSGISMINSADIESIQVLKDASSASIYGSRAANGVVIVTTKKGTRGKTQIAYDGMVGVQNVSNTPDLLNSQQFGDAYFQALKNGGITPNHVLYGNGANAVVPEFLNAAKTIRSGDTKWFDEIYRAAIVQSHNVMLTSGSETARQAFSAGYYKQDGILKHTDFTRYSVRLNSDYNILDRVKIGENIGVSYAERTGANSNLAIGGVTGDAYKAHPMTNVYDINGAFAGPVSGLNDIRNPLAALFYNKDNTGKTLRILGNVFAEVSLLKGLTAKTDFAMDYNTFNQRSYSSKYNEGPITSQAISNLNQQNIVSKTWTWSNTLNYNATIDKHVFDILAGSEAIRYYSEFFTAYRDIFPVDILDGQYLDAGQGLPKNSGSGIKSTLFSLFAKANYTFNDRYLFSATVRRDASSKLADGYNTQVFPAFSAGWRLSEEDFIKNSLPFVSNMKLRFGWGQTGNQEIAPYAAYSSFGLDLYNTTYDMNGSNTSLVPGIAQKRYGNDQLKWETTTQTNFGIDLGLWDERVTLTADYFNKDTKDLLVQPKQPAVFGQASAPYINGGSMNNKGIEIAVNYLSDRNKAFRYEIGGNIAFIKNKLTSLTGDISYISSPASNNLSRGLELQRTTVGQPISSFYGHQVVGIFKTAEEVAAAPSQTGKGVGRIRYADLNNDNIINANDRTFLGSPIPTMTYGINLKADYKAFDMSVFFQGVTGNKIYNFMKYHNDFFFDQFNKSTNILNAWTPDNSGSMVPALSTVDANNELRPSTYFIESGAYLRLKNVQIGYTLPGAIAEKIHVAKLRVFIQGQNLLTFTNYTGLDPEVGMQNYSSDNRNLDMGVDRGLYPNSRTYTFGLGLTF